MCGAVEGVEVARSALHQLITVLCLSLLAVIIAVPRLLLNTMLIFAVYLLPASAFCVMVCFMMIAVIVSARFVLFGIYEDVYSIIFAQSARDGTYLQMGYQCFEPLFHIASFVLALDLIVELLRWQRAIVDHLIVLERMSCSLTTGKYVRQYIYSGDLTNFVAFVGMIFYWVGCLELVLVE